MPWRCASCSRAPRRARGAYLSLRRIAHPDSLRVATRILGSYWLMLRAAVTSGGQVVGALSALRFDMRPLSDNESRLLKSFADQAVVAIQNARLFFVAKEALEQGDRDGRGAAVSSPTSPTDVNPVLDAVAERAARICEAQFTHAAARGRRLRAQGRFLRLVRTADRRPAAAGRQHGHGPGYRRPDRPRRRHPVRQRRVPHRQPAGHAAWRPPSWPCH